MATKAKEDVVDFGNFEDMAPRPVIDIELANETFCPKKKEHASEAPEPADPYICGEFEHAVLATETVDDAFPDVLWPPRILEGQTT